MRRSKPFIISSLGLILALTLSSVLAMFSNGDFETGDFSGWTRTTFLNNGLSGSAPFSGGSIVRNPGGVQTSAVVGGPAVQPLSQSDSATGNVLKYPRFGHYAARVGDTTPNYNANTLSQSTTITAADVDSTDNKVHARFAFAPVLQNGGHGPNDQPFFYIAVKNVTRGTLLYETFNFSGQSGVPWQLAANSVQFTDWQLVDIAPGNASLAVGDTISLEVVAAGCSQSGHFGYVYVDGFGADIPGLNVSATAPGQANPGGSLTYTFNYHDSGALAFDNVVIKENIPAQTTFASTSNPGACAYSAGVVTCNLGTLNPGDSGTVQITVNVNPGASGTITNGNYSISGTGSPPLLGPPVSTTVTSTPLVDVYVTKTDGQLTVAAGAAVNYTIVAGNNGPSPVTGATLADTMPAKLVNVTWTCVATAGATCTASGTGSINDTIDLPAGSIATYSVAGTVKPDASGSLVNNVSITAPGGVTDSTPSNNTDADTDSIIADTTPPAPPTIDAIGSTSNTSPAIKGKGDAGSTVVVLVDNAPFCTVTVDSNGDWSCPISSFTEGSHTVSATASDAANNTSSPTTMTFTVDTIAPAAPTVTSPESGGATNDITPAFGGKSEPGSKVTVQVDGVDVCSATADGAGNWGCSSTVTLAAGLHNVTASAKDAAQNAGPASTSQPFTIDLTPPAAPTVTAPGNGDLMNTATPTFTGKADAGSIVKVKVDGVEVCQATADSNGDWSCTPTTGLGQGSHGVVATATDPAGNDSTDATLTIEIDSLAPSAPTIGNANVTGDTTPTIFGTAEASSAVTVTVDGNFYCTATTNGTGNWTCEGTTVLTPGSHNVSATAVDTAHNTSGAATLALTIDTAQPDAPAFTSPSITSDTTPQFAGTAEPNGTVKVFVDGVLYCTATANGAGVWSCTSTTVLSAGDHTVTATSTDAANNTSPAATQPLTIDTGAPGAPTITSPAATNDTTPAIFGTAEPGSTVSVTIDGAAYCTDVASSSGAWSCIGTTVLAVGDHVVSVKATDAANNVSPAATQTLAVDLTAPAAPVVTGPESGSSVNGLPTFGGTGEPGSTVSVMDGSTIICTATVDSAGNWSCTAAAPLSDGNHSISIVVTDPAGNSSTTTEVAVNVDATAPTQPVITSPSSTIEHFPIIFGRSEPGSTVTVVIDPDNDPATNNSITYVVPTNTAGIWLINTASAQPLSGTFPVDGFAQGQNVKVEATARDQAGNTSDAARQILYIGGRTYFPSIVLGAAGK
jgi:uncharacterized repeat protein (TIGR01451 family)